MDDACLWREAISGGAAASDAFVKRYGPLISGILLKFHDLEPAEREDLQQEVLLTLFDHGLREFRGSTDHEFRYYLKTIVENKAKSLLRLHSRRFEKSGVFASTEEEGTEAFDPPDQSYGPEETAIARDVLKKIRGCMSDIPLIDQEIFWMRQRDISYADIRKPLGLPMGTVATKFRRAMAKIEDCLRAAGIS